MPRQEIRSTVQHRHLTGAGVHTALQPGYQRGSTSATKQDDDILSRAKQNVQENDQDLLKEADHLQHEAARGAADAPILTPSQQVAMQPEKAVGQKIGAKFDEDCDNRKKIQDLMIMGYSGNLEFERDFVAEGVDMLTVIRSSEAIYNSFELACESGKMERQQGKTESRRRQRWSGFQKAVNFTAILRINCIRSSRWQPIRRQGRSW